jgi:hypothetical protein
MESHFDDDEIIIYWQQFIDSSDMFIEKLTDDDIYSLRIIIMYIRKYSLLNFMCVYSNIAQKIPSLVCKVLNIAPLPRLPKKAYPPYIFQNEIDLLDTDVSSFTQDEDLYN